MEDKFYKLRQQLNRLKHDNCEMCMGIKGRTPGNENVIDGIVVCDYCHSILMEMARFRKEKK